MRLQVNVCNGRNNFDSDLQWGTKCPGLNTCTAVILCVSAVCVDWSTDVVQESTWFDPSASRWAQQSPFLLLVLSQCGDGMWCRNGLPVQRYILSNSTPYFAGFQLGELNPFGIHATVLWTMWSWWCELFWEIIKMIQVEHCIVLLYYVPSVCLHTLVQKSLFKLTHPRSSYNISILWNCFIWKSTCWLKAWNISTVSPWYEIKPCELASRAAAA